LKQENSAKKKRKGAANNETMDSVLEHIKKRYKELLPQAAQHQLGYHFPIIMDADAAYPFAGREYA
jgi:hypothetical protein